MRDSNKTLSDQIENLVRKHIEATRREAAEAMERVFAASAPSQRSSRAARPKASRGRAEPQSSAVRRTTEELEELAERLYEAVLAEPGKTMMVLCRKLGATALELNRPMMRLKRDGRIRSVGQRQQTRYYPTAAGR